MNIKGFVLYREIVDKIYFKHNVVTDEVEEVFQKRPKYLFVEKGNQKDEDVYMALGRSNAGRYPTILFIYKKTQKVLILSARDMEKKKEDTMAKREVENSSNLPWQNHTIDELVAYFDTHDMGDHLDQLQEVEFEVDIQEKTHIFWLDEDMAEKLTEIALSEKKSSKELINSWLKEKIEAYH